MKKKKPTFVYADKDAVKDSPEYDEELLKFETLHRRMCPLSSNIGGVSGSEVIKSLKKKPRTVR
jgi:hypothetical protein